MFQPPQGSLKQRYGDWALVTGASSGIGLEFARALAQDGVSLVLAARRVDRLASAADELAKQHGVEARAVACDLATPEGVRACLAAVDGLDLAILVNNAGVGLPGPLRAPVARAARGDGAAQLRGAGGAHRGAAAEACARAGAAP